ncbi:Transporter MCH4-like protein [Elsinoe fawcettii]|nr:Transporter MCH4-like protein [Elsinoe fawcettii]
MKPSNPEIDRETRSRNDACPQEGAKNSTSSVQQASCHARTYPEGGKAAWLVVVGSFSGMLAVSSVLNNLGVYHAYLANNQLKDKEESAIGWIFGLFAFMTFFFGVLVGPVFDTRGPRMLVATGSVLTVLWMALLGFCSQYWHFVIVFGFMGGLATSLVYTPAVSVISHWFLKRRGQATGTALTAGGLAGVIFPFVLQTLFEKVGFAWATRAQALIFVVLLALANILIRARLPPSSAAVLFSWNIFNDKIFLITIAGTWFQE